MKQPIKLGYCGTLHGYALRLLERMGKVVVMDEAEAKEAFRAHAQKLGYRGTWEALEQVRQDKLNSTVCRSERPQRAELVVSSWFAEMPRTGAFDFDGLLYWGLEALAGQQESVHLLVDEVQDMAPVDAQFYLRLNCATRFFVGDPDQCQPAGTLVSMSNGKLKPIEEIQVGECVVSYARHEKKLIKSAKVTTVAKRLQAGVLYTVFAGSYSTRCTGNHRWLIKWPSGAERQRNLWATYLMRRGDHFRVGKTAFFRSGSGKGDILGPVLRLRQEKADSVWVLRLHATHADAVAYEAIISANYGLPQACFTAVKTNVNYTQKALDSIFDGVKVQFPKAVHCLQDHGRELEHPLFDRRDKRTRRTVQEVRACNLLGGVMRIPVAGRGYDSRNRDGVWQPLRVSAWQFKGEVYSLDVEKHHKYVADGLVTCNSIYGFRGADVGQMLRFVSLQNGVYVPHANDPTWAVFTLSTNYRSGEDICDAANALISHNTKRVPKVCVPVLGNHAADLETWSGFPTAAEEQKAVCADIRKHCSDAVAGSLEECAVLLRTNELVDAYAKALESYSVPVARRKPRERPADWKRCKVILSALADPLNDHLAWRLVHAVRGEAVAKKLRYDAAASRTGLAEFSGIVPATVRASEAADWLVRFGVEPESVALAKAALDRSPSVAAALLSLAQEERSEVETGQGVTVCTMHAAKGREWGTVYLPAFEQAVIPANREVEEERRLAFVAFTRAKKRLVVSWVQSRKKNKWADLSPAEPSRFVRESEGRP